MRRTVFDDMGGYDESLRASDDFELRLQISRKYEIGRVAKSLLRRRILYPSRQPLLQMAMAINIFVSCQFLRNTDPSVERDRHQQDRLHVSIYTRIHFQKSLRSTPRARRQ